MKTAKNQTARLGVEPKLWFITDTVSCFSESHGCTDLDKHCFGELIDLIGSIELKEEAGRSKDISIYGQESNPTTHSQRDAKYLLGVELGVRHLLRQT